jgi:hypothetical protein
LTSPENHKKKEAPNLQAWTCLENVSCILFLFHSESCVDEQEKVSGGSEWLHSGRSEVPKVHKDHRSSRTSQKKADKQNGQLFHFT